MRVAVEEAVCVGAGQCVLAAPDVFDQDENDGVVIVLEDNPPAQLHGPVREAEALCPARAISVTDD